MDTRVPTNPFTIVEKQNRKRRTIAIFFWGTTTLAFAALFFLAQTQVRAIQRTRGEREWAITYLDRIARLSRDAENISRVTGELEAALPNAQRIPTELIPQVTKLANERKLVSVISIGALEEQGEEKEVSRLHLSISLTGSLSDMEHFLVNLKEQFITLSIERLEISKGEKGQYNALLESVMFVRTKV